MTSKKRGRGRPRLKDSDRKSEPVGVRLTKELRARLEAEADSEGRSLTQEIELRLRESFNWEKDVDTLFGGRHTRLFFQVLAERVRSIEISAGGTDGPEPDGRVRIRWLDDPFTYDLVRSMFETVVRYLRPRGRRVVPKALRWHPSVKRDVANLGRDSALRALVYLRNLKNENPADPPDLPHPPFYRRAASLLGKQTADDPADEWQAIWRRQRRGVTGAISNEEYRRRDAITARAMTVQVISKYLRDRLTRGAEVDLAEVFAGITGANLAEQKLLVVERIKAATRGRFKRTIKVDGKTLRVDVDSDIKQILDADRSQALGDEMIPTGRYREWAKQGRTMR